MDGVSPMSPTLRRRGLRVSAEHLAKMAVEVTGSCHTLAELVHSDCRARWDVEAITFRVALDAIKHEIAELEALVGDWRPEATKATLPLAAE